MADPVLPTPCRAPRFAVQRLLAVLLSVMGVPLVVLISVSAGEALSAAAAERLAGRMETRALARSGRAPTARSTLVAAASAAAATLAAALTLLLLLAACVATGERWAFGEALYFISSTMTGAGFGDVTLLNAPLAALVVLLLATVAGFAAGAAAIRLLRGAVTGDWGQEVLLAADSASGGVALLDWEQQMLDEGPL